MSEIINNPNECKPVAVDASDAAELIRARQSSPALLKKLLEFHRKRGVTTAEIVAAMAASPVLVNPIGRK
jgi:hypothetical protein